MYLLDTNHCSRIIFGETNVIRGLQEHIGLGVATSVIVQGELLYMVQKSSQYEANLRFVRTFLQTIDLYPINGGVADVYGSLKGKIVEHFGPKDKAKRRKFTVQDLGFSDNDLWIASTALHYKLTICFRGQRFSKDTTGASPSFRILALTSSQHLPKLYSKEFQIFSSPLLCALCVLCGSFL